MDNRTLQELKRAYIEAEERHRDAYRRAIWLEKRLYEASTEEEFSSRQEELKTCEKMLQELAIIVSHARRIYVAAELATRSTGATI